MVHLITCASLFFLAILFVRRLPREIQSKGIVLALLGTWTALLISEIALHFFLVRSDFFGFTYAAARWWDTYWTPVNRRGYRDYDYSAEELRGKKVALVVGDSIVAGQGIDHINDRFTNLLNSHLGEDWVVLNIAQCGWNTRHELSALKETLIETPAPDLIILVYYSNDFDIAFTGGVMQPQGGIYEVAKHSALLDFIYWQSFRLRHKDLGSTYWSALKQAWGQDAQQVRHLAELSEFSQLAAKHSHQFLVVLTPTLPDPSIDRFIRERVKEHLTSEGIKVIDLEQSLVKLPTKERVVSSVDHHPGRSAHRVIAEVLRDAVRSHQKE